MAAFARERSPPRGDRRPLSKRNASREKRAAAGGATDTYGQIRDKALAQRSKTVPAEVFIGEAPKRARAVPPNAAQLKRRQARTTATKRPASVPADDVRIKTRGGPADAQCAAVRQKLADNSRLYEDKQVNIKSKRVAKTVTTKRSKDTEPESRVAKSVTTKKGKDVSYEPQSNRPEDRYGVRRRAQRAKNLSVSRLREPVGVLV